MTDKPYVNTNREIYRKDDDSIFVTEGDGIGISVGGNVIVLPLEQWHQLAERFEMPVSGGMTDRAAKAYAKFFNEPVAFVSYEAIRAALEAAIHGKDE